MTDTQHLNVPEVLPIDNNSTLPKKGHRHKRSLAMSGDFDFLKQPGSVPPIVCSSPVSASNNTYTHNNQMTQSSQMDSPSELESMPRSPFKLPNQMANLSPRFFISEEPKFSSPFQGVPDAIINLDDALKTKPKTFKSHKRCESAPPDLAIFLNPKSIKNANIMIEEEEDDEDSQSLSDDSNSLDRKDTILPSLLSPLRPKSPTPNSPHVNTTDSPLQSRKLGNPRNGSQVNSLKINGQKQRYHYYTKKLPINAASSIQAQTLSEKQSSSSLSSAFIKTPLSTTGTPSKQISTPSTPVSATNSGTGYNGCKSDNQDRGLISPIRAQRSSIYKTRNSNNSGNNNASGKFSHGTFNYETMIYDMPHDTSGSKSSCDSNTLAKQDTLLPEEEDAKNGTSTKEKVNDCGILKETKKEIPISKEILCGEPGDAVDLSIYSQRQDSLTAFKSSTREIIMPMTQAASVVNESISPTFEPSQESRSFSDSALLVEAKGRKEKRKVKSKLNNFFTNFFTKNSNETSPHDKKT